MRVTCIVLVALASTCLGGVPSEAGQAANKVGLYVGSINASSGRVDIPSEGDRVKAGHVLFRLTQDDGMAIRVRLQDGPPNTTFQVRVVPRLPWDYTNQTYTLTTNAQGKANWATELPNPYAGGNHVQVKVRLYDPDTDTAFATELHTFDL